MPTTFTDQFLVIDPFSPPPNGTAMTCVNYTLTDQNDDLDFDRFDNGSVNGSDITSSYPGDTVTIFVPRAGNLTYTGITFYLANGQVLFTPNDGQVLQNGVLQGTTFVTSRQSLPVADLGPPCFAAGTMIETAQGEVPVEQIKVGDLVQTLDHGLQPVRWHGDRVVPGSDVLAPIRFSAGALGSKRPLLVSPQHQILITGWRAEMFFGEDEALVKACHMVNHDTIFRVPMRHVSYHHLMFDAHELIYAEGALAESFFPGPQIMQDETAAIFPEVVHEIHEEWSTAPMMMKSREATMLYGDKIKAA